MKAAGSPSPAGESHASCCKAETSACPCPACGNPGRKVTSRTLDEHVEGRLRQVLGDGAAFCPDPACPVVYCGPSGAVVRKGQTKLPVTSKDPGEDVLVCYCFGHRRSDLRRDLRQKGATDIPERIRAELNAGRCDCERANPKGACCLGDVARVIAEMGEGA